MLTAVAERAAEPVQPRPRRRSACHGCSSTAAGEPQFTPPRQRQAARHAGPRRSRAGSPSRCATPATPHRSPAAWGDLGWEELDRRRARREPADRRAVLVPVQRPPRGQGDLPDRGDHRGALHGRRHRRAHRAAPLGRHARPGCTSGRSPRRPTWSACRSAATTRSGSATGPVPQVALLPARLRKRAAHDFGRHPAIMTTLRGLLRALPVRATTQLVVTDDELETRSRPRACRSSGRTTSTGGAPTSGSSRTSSRTSGSATASRSPTGATSGSTRASRPTRNGCGRRRPAAATAAAHARQWHAHVAAQPADLVLADPGVARMFDERVYKRGALTLHALRAPDRRRALLRAAARLDGAAPPRDGDDGAVRRAGRAARRHGPRRFFTAWLHRPALPDEGR